jgi:hypothetical protein
VAHKTIAITCGAVTIAKSVNSNRYYAIVGTTVAHTSNSTHNQNILSNFCRNGDSEKISAKNVQLSRYKPQSGKFSDGLLIGLNYNQTVLLSCWGVV